MDIVHDPETGKRKMIERALGRCAEYPYRECCKTHRLAEQAIVEKGTWYPEGRFVKDGAIYNWCKNPIRCTAIILPDSASNQNSRTNGASREEEDGNQG